MEVQRHLPDSRSSRSIDRTERYDWLGIIGSLCKKPII